MTSKQPRDHLSPDINAALDREAELGGLWLKDIGVGVIVTVETRNSTYKLARVDEGTWRIRGGTRWPKPAEVGINGSTFGGSMIRVGWLGLGMYMEIVRTGDGSIVTTSSIKSLGMEAGDEHT